MFNDYDGVANGPDEGINIAKALADKDFVILQNHAILTTGSIGRYYRLVFSEYGGGL